MIKKIRDMMVRIMGTKMHTKRPALPPILTVLIIRLEKTF